MLYQLPKTGNWVSLYGIQRIAAMPRELLPGGRELPHRVVVQILNGCHESIECDTKADAIRIRDEIAAVANAATSREPEPAESS